VLEHAGIRARPTLLWPSPAARGGEVASTRGGAGAALALLVTLLSVAVAALLCWKGAAAWQRIRLSKARPRRAGAGAWAAVAEEEDHASGREEEGDILFKLSSLLQM